MCPGSLAAWLLGFRAADGTDASAVQDLYRQGASGGPVVWVDSFDGAGHKGERIE
jgi:hypothetical protein